MKRIRTIARRATRLSAYIMRPLLIEVATRVTTFVSLVLTDKCLPCVLYLQTICIKLLCRFTQTACLQASKASGWSDAFLKWDIRMRMYYTACKFRSMSTTCAEIRPKYQRKKLPS